MKIETVNSATFSRGNLVFIVKAFLLILTGIFASLRSFSKDRPAIVIGFGGYPTIPALTTSCCYGCLELSMSRMGFWEKLINYLPKMFN